MKDIEEIYLFVVLAVFIAFLFPLAFTAIGDAEITNSNSVLFNALPIILVVLFIVVPVTMILAWRGNL